MLLEELKDWGCDIDGALERFVGDKELYLSCLYTVLDDKAFAGLGEALRGNRIKEAFDCAHILKGVLANLGLTPMYDVTVRLVEPLRAGNAEGLLPVYEELLETRTVLAGLLARAAREEE